MQEAWRAMEDFLAAKRTCAIGVSNYCQSTIDCLLAKARVVPAVNQVMWHVGMGPDPIGLRSYCALKNITLQAYSPLGDGSSELITGDLVSGIGSSHNKRARKSPCAGSHSTACPSPPRRPTPNTWRRISTSSAGR